MPTYTNGILDIQRGLINNTSIGHTYQYLYIEGKEQRTTLSYAGIHHTGTFIAIDIQLQ